MSASPEHEVEAEPAATGSPNDNENQPTDEQNEEGMSRPEDVGYDFEVKEQDRWLPIANGESMLSPSLLRCVL